MPIFWTFLTLLFLTQVKAAELTIRVSPCYSGQPLRLDSLRYAHGEETISVTRLSILLTDFALQKEDGTWQPLATGNDNAVLIDVAARKLTGTFPSVPSENFRALRFAVGPNTKTNHADPALYAAKHPLNPNNNRMHWDWKGGYIFLALEGHYRPKGKAHSGYVLHFANDANRTLINLPINVKLEHPTRLDLTLDIASLLSAPRAIFFSESASTHSRKGDPLAASIKANLPSAFQIKRILTIAPPDKAPPKKKPLYLPSDQRGFPFKMSARFPIPDLPTDNPLLKSRVALGKKLFHDTTLSRDRTISCASCHQAQNAFSDSRRVSVGVGGVKGERNSMPLFNLAWKKEFFWDGRAPSIRDQVLKPIADHKEMAQDLPSLVARLKASEDYPTLFAKAFQPGHISEETISLALENFLLTLTSHDSKFDQAMKGKKILTDKEKRGFELFMTEYEPRSRQYGADCFHCHGGALFTNHQFHNNGLGIDPSDLGRSKVTGKSSDHGKFSTPSLRNIALTAPYMHDGRFKTIEEVLNHYNTGIQRSETLDPNLAKHPKSGIKLSQEDLASLAAFLRTLTDEKYRNASSRPAQNAPRDGNP